MQLLKNILVITFAGAVTVAQSLLLPKTARRESQPSERPANAAKWKWRALKLGAVFAVLGVVGLLVMVSGIIPIKASSGHWPITAWFLNFAKQRSVATQSSSLSAPALDKPRLVLQGAAHYEIGCAACHGSPAQRVPKIAGRLTPPPPDLTAKVPQYDATELFYIVKHGLKFTGMPAWPTPERDDEVWAMVAFLQQLPKLDAASYHRLVHGAGNQDGRAFAALLPPENVPRAVNESCVRCHGLDGQGREYGAFPNLAGQQAEYLYASLQAYAQEKRHSGTMESTVSGLSAEAMRELANYYARLPRPAPTSNSDAAGIARGALIAQNGIPTQQVPACIACHGPGAEPRNPVYPKLAGQAADYLELQLQLFKRQQRGGTAYAHLMRLPSAGLSAEQMRDVALYYASLP